MKRSLGILMIVALSAQSLHAQEPEEDIEKMTLQLSEMKAQHEKTKAIYDIHSQLLRLVAERKALSVIVDQKPLEEKALIQAQLESISKLRQAQMAAGKVIQSSADVTVIEAARKEVRDADQQYQLTGSRLRNYWDMDRLTKEFTKYGVKDAEADVKKLHDLSNEIAEIRFKMSGFQQVMNSSSAIQKALNDRLWKQSRDARDVFNKEQKQKRDEARKQQEEARKKKDAERKAAMEKAKEEKAKGKKEMGDPKKPKPEQEPPQKD